MSDFLTAHLANIVVLLIEKLVVVVGRRLAAA
jgi:hypothetical protein